MNCKDPKDGTILPYGPSQEKSEVTDGVTRPLLLQGGGGAAKLENTQVYTIPPNDLCQQRSRGSFVPTLSALNN